MANLDKLLKKIEKNYNEADKQETKEFTVGGETYEVLTLTRSEKSKFLYTKPNKENATIGEIVDWIRPFIYRTFQLNDIAVKAKDAGYIKKYHDVVDILFEPSEIVDIASFIIEINDIQQTTDEEVDEIKK